MSFKRLVKNRLPTPLWQRGSALREHYLGTVTGCQTQERIVALTFDDGPMPESTPHILDMLELYDVKATFFLLGQNVADHPQIARAIVKRGHAIGNHTFNHPRLADLNPVQVARELRRCQRTIEDAVGASPALMRPPYGAQSPGAALTARMMGHTIVHWSVSGDDWLGDPATLVAERVLAKVTPGSIVLLHDGWTPTPERRRGLSQADTAAQSDRTATIAALPIIIKNLQQDGYRFVTVPDMLQTAQARKALWFA